jgi:3-hydroxyacyl-CoA dehydrogenase
MEIKICVLGAGLMGRDCPNGSGGGVRGLHARHRDRFVQGGLKTIRKNYERAVSKGKMTQEQADKNLARVKGGSTWGVVRPRWSSRR